MKELKEHFKARLAELEEKAHWPDECWHSPEQAERERYALKIRASELRHIIYTMATKEFRQELSNALA